MKGEAHMQRRLSVFLVLSLTLAFLASCVPPAQPAMPATLTALPTSPPSLGPLPSPSTEELVQVVIFFTNRDRYAAGTPPFETGVIRWVPAAANLPEAVLQAFFAGPTAEERAQGLEAITSGFDGFSALVIEDDIARVYLTGRCASNGATYTIAQPLMKNLLQFEALTYVKIYDENGETELPDGQTNSIPFCLEP
jgi:hypothetical protein